MGELEDGVEGFGTGFTNTVMSAFVDGQLGFKLTDDTVYVVVAVGLAVTDAPVVDERPVAGDQE